MTTTPSEFTAFTQSDIVYDDGCSEECDKNESLAYVNRENPEDVIHLSCLMTLTSRARLEYVEIETIPSGKLTAEQRADVAIGDSIDEEEEYELDEPIQADLSREAVKGIILGDYESGQSRP